MLVEVKSAEQARVLELDGYSRIGSGGKAIEATMDEAMDILERDDASVEKIVVERSNSEDEAQLIDNYLRQGYSGRTREYRVWNNGMSLRRRGNTVMEVSEHKLVIKDSYRSVLDGSFDPRPSEDDFEGAKEEALEEGHESIQKKQEELRDLEDELIELEDYDYEAFIEEKF